MKKRVRIMTALFLSAAMTLGSMTTGFAAEAVSADSVELEEEYQGEISEEGTGSLSGDTADEDTMTEDKEGTKEDTGSFNETGNGEENINISAEEVGDGDAEPEDAETEITVSADTEPEKAEAEITVSADAGEGDTEGKEAEAVIDAAAGEESNKEEDRTEEISENKAVSGDMAAADKDASEDSTGDEDEAEEEGSAGNVRVQDVTHSYVTIEKKQEYNGGDYSPSYTVPADHKLLSENRFDSPTLASANQAYTFKGIRTVSQSKTFYVYKNDASSNDDFDFKIEIRVTPKPVTFRSGTYTKVEDGKPLSQNSAEGAMPPEVVKGSMVTGESFDFIFDPEASITTVTNAEYSSVKNTFKVSENGTAEKINYEISYEYGDLILSKQRTKINDLGTPLKVKAVMDKKGAVKITWKKVTSYKENGKRGGKTYYKIARYKEDGTWETLTDSLKKKKYIDSSPKAGERLIYRIIAEGIDSSGNSGECREPAYVRVTPKIISATPYDGVHYVNVNFVGSRGRSDEYTVRHWNTKNKSRVDDMIVNRYNSEASTYEGKTRTVSTCSFLDAGGDSVTISGNNKATFAFKVRANETYVYDFGERKTVGESSWSKAVKVKMVSLSPYLVGEYKSRGSFTLKWTKIKKATGYLIEYSLDDSFTKSNTKEVYVGKDKKTSDFEKREYDVSNVAFGVPYYCRVTSYLKKKGDGSEYGIPLGTSQVVVEYGRQKKVQNLDAEYYEDGNYKADAKLTWTDSEERVQGYYVQKWTYEYDSETKDYKVKKHEVLQGYTSQNSARKKYVNTAGDRINNGDLVKYRVQSVIFDGGNKGEFRDGYVFSEPAEYFYMNPKEIRFKKSKYIVKVGEKLKPDYKLYPKKLPKTIDGLTKEQFKEAYDCEFKDIFLFNKELEFKLESDDLNGDGIKKYVTVDGTDGELKGIKEYKKTYITLKVSSPNDPYNVYDTAIIQVAAGDGSSGSETERPKNKLVVCIDPGHGGKDDGTDHNGVKEKDKNLEIAKKLKNHLEKGGATVYMTRTSDEFVKLTDRTDYADDKNCNLFISIHCNYSDNSSRRGTEVYYSVKSEYAKKKLASAISKAVSKALDTDNIGAKTRNGDNGDYYAVIRNSAAKGIPGLIVEHAFVSNTADANALKNEETLEKMATAEAEAILDNWK